MKTTLYSLLLATVIVAVPAAAQTNPTEAHNHAAPPAPAAAPAMPDMPNMPNMPGMRRMQILMQGPGPAGERSMGAHGGMGEQWRHHRYLQLATVSPRLGSYFGAKSGVLVAHSEKPELKLEDGDVITAIDGREPTSAQQAHRILRSYAPGEKISFKLLRDRKTLTVEGVMPERAMPDRPMPVEFKMQRREIAPAPKAP